MNRRSQWRPTRAYIAAITLARMSYSPRRQRNACLLLAHLRWRGGKLYLTSADYGALRRSMKLDSRAIRQAVDDLAALNAISIRLIGDLEIVEVKQ